MNRSSVGRASVVAAHLAVLLGGAIFGFFYAWTCSTMWGLDRADPRVSIAAMQEMNASVRNAVFFPAFFLTPVAMASAAALAWWDGARRAFLALATGAGLYLLGGLLLTMTVNVPMNEDLAQVVIPQSIEDARLIWEDYSGRWQLFNQIRALVSGTALAAASYGLWRLGRHAERGPSRRKAQGAT